jgi:CDP-2,3-bis-(O-geranylgeranyl)-sn-glycerol synthase
VNLLQHIVWSLWFLGPAGAGNVAPLIAAHLPWAKHLNAPIDGGRTLRGKRLMGDHKTWRGLVAGLLFGGLAGALQLLLASHFDLRFIPAGAPHYASAEAIWLGMLLGIGALIGDAAKSIIKRQVGVPPGKHWIPFDQIDYIIGALLISAPFTRLSAEDMLIALLVWLGIHLGMSYVGYLIKWKDDPI